MVVSWESELNPVPFDQPALKSYHVPNTAELLPSLFQTVMEMRLLPSLLLLPVLLL
jgi:hypothetical protein